MSALRLAAERVNENLLTEDQAIDALGLRGRPNPKSSLRWLMRIGKLAYVRLGRGVYGFKPDDITTFIASNRVAPQGQR